MPYGEPYHQYFKEYDCQLVFLMKAHISINK